MQELTDGLILYHGSYCEVKTPELRKCAVHMFKETDAEWLHCIAGHRKIKIFSDVVKKMGNYDVVIGKIANDATNFTLTTYMSGAYGELGSKEADEDCIRRLLPERLRDQYCFRTNVALGCLTFVESERVWI